MSDARARGGKTLILQDPPVTVAVRRSRAARRLSLSVSHIDGAARVTAPRHCSEAAVRRFVEGHRDWLKTALGAAPDIHRIEDGAILPFAGARLHLRGDASRRGVRLSDDGAVLWVGGPSCEIGLRVEAWLREQARARLVDCSHRHAAALGLAFSRITIRDTRSRWGSCSSSGALSYSWRLIFAPPRVLDYVAAHEVAHLKEMNHSARFWAVVERLKPDWRGDRDWLKRHGAELHRYQVPPIGPSAAEKAA